jgi:hypothetical protein
MGTNINNKMFGPDTIEKTDFVFVSVMHYI